MIPTPLHARHFRLATHPASLRPSCRPAARSVLRMVTALLLVSGTVTGVARADGGVTFDNIAADGGAGIDFARHRGALFASVEAVRDASLSQPIPFPNLALLPNSDAIHGLVGVAVLDFDGDGDLDIYATNGPGVANSLYANQLVETGDATFVDVASAVGADLTAQTGAGVCYGDLDNDGDPEILVLGRSEDNLLLENHGGAFTTVSPSGLEGGALASTSCAMGDIDGDGLLDVFIANNFHDDVLLPIFAEPFALNQPNQLFRNRGDGSFEDISAGSGIYAMASIPPGVATITWAVGMVDIDQDGDLDLLQADDQGAFPIARDGGLDRGFLHIFLNGGSGHFVDEVIDLNDTSSGSWMGFAVADVNCDSHLDLLGSNFGDYNLPTFGAPYLLGDQSTRLHFGNGDGTFSDGGVGDLGASVFGWGSSAFDYDNDGDTDLLYHGGLEMNFLVFADNPGVLMRNQGCGTFELDSAALTTDHQVRTVHGVATGDLDDDGFTDIVSAANLVLSPLLPVLLSPATYGSVLDTTAGFSPTYTPTPDGFVWTGIDHQLGDLAVEINSGNNGNRWIKVKTLGTVGITSGGQVNRDGIGAVVSVTPRHGQTATVPVQSGSTYLSQHSLEIGFGLGHARRATVDVLWPGGTRNRLHHVRQRSRLNFPEIPCSIDSELGFVDYLFCVGDALEELRGAGVISRREDARFFWSALVGYLEEH